MLAIKIFGGGSVKLSKGISIQNGALLAMFVIFLVSVSYIVAVFAIPLYTGAGNISPASGTAYSPAATYWFNQTWVNQSAAENITMCNVTIGRPDGSLTVYSQLTTPAVGLNSTVPPTLCNFSLTQSQLGAAGTYNYTFSAENDTNNWNTSFPTTTYVVAQNTSTANYMNITINGVEANQTFTYGTVTTVSFSNSISGEFCAEAYTYGTYRGCSPLSDPITLHGVGSYTYVINTSGNTNYSASAGKFLNMNITQANVPLALYINGTDDNKQLNESASSSLVAVNFTVVGTFAGVTPSTLLQLWTNHTGAPVQWTNGSAPVIINITNMMALGVYNITGYFPGDVNYTANITTHYLTIADVTNPTVFLGMPGNFTGILGPGVFNTSTGNLTFMPNDLHLTNCSLWANFGGSWVRNQTLVNGTNLTNVTWNNFSVTLPDGTYIWNVKCYDTSGNNAFNTTGNYTLRVATPPMFQPIGVYLNDTDNFYSNCSNNKVIHLVANLTQASLTVTANFSTIEGDASAVVTMDDKGSGIYTANYTVTNTTGAFFEPRVILVNASNVVGWNMNGTAAVIYNMTIPDANLTTNSTNFCYVQNFSAIPNVTFEKADYGKIVFIDNINLSTPQQGVMLANLSANLNITNKTIGINSTYFSELNKSAVLTMYNTPVNLTQKLTFIPEGSSLAQYCNGTFCISPTWNGTTNITTFNITMFSKYIADDAAPVITPVGPTGTYNVGSVNLQVSTNERAVCSYSTNDTSYGNMTAFVTTNSINHTQPLSLTTGSYIYYVKCKDVANNTNVNSTSIGFAINIISTSTEPSGGGYTPPPTTPSGTYSFGSIGAGQTASTTVDVPNVPVTGVSLTVDEAVSNVHLTVSSYTTMPSTISIGAPGNVYDYLSISTTAPSTAVTQIQINFKVPVSWVTSNNIDPATITLNHYVDGAWTTLTTTQTTSDGTYYYFTATTSSLSYFAITGQIVGVTPPVAGCPTCDPATEWSDCVDGTQTRTAYGCSATTNYTCEASEESRQCGAITLPTGVTTNMIVWIVIIAAAAVVIVYYAIKWKENKIGHRYKYRPKGLFS